MTTFFLAGIIQGSLTGDGIHAQDYRERLKAAIRRAVPDADIYCPIEHHPQSLAFAEDHARQVFFDLMRRAAEADVLVAYVPEASMGTAIEMWKAFEAGVPLVTVSPLAANWVVKHLSDVVLPDLDAFRLWIAGGGLDKLLKLD
jgi:hypothetical protein